ncbi:MAG: PorT family protein [Fibromonadales bacterium]|nr:PorT family protein [Fibromonadales bacterium]
MKIIKIFLIFLISCIGIKAHAIQTLAVLEITSKSDDVSLTIQELRHLTDELRRQAVQILPHTGYAILTRDNILSLLPPDEEEAECLSESCAVSIGRTIGAEFVSQGEIGIFAGELSLSIELYETMSGKLLGSIVMESHDTKGLMGAIREQAPGLFSKILSSKATMTSEEKKEEKPQPQEQKIEEKKPEEAVSDKIRVGIRAGFNFSIYNDDSDDYDIGKSFGGGLSVRIPFTSWLFLNPGLDFYYRELFSWNGGDGVATEFTISIPILFQFMLIEGFYFAAGPQFGIPIKSEVKYKDKTYDMGRTKFDIDVALGFGYMIVPSFGFDFRGIMSTLPSFGDSGNYDKKFGSLIQFGTGVTYFF